MIRSGPAWFHWTLYETRRIGVNEADHGEAVARVDCRSHPIGGTPKTIIRMKQKFLITCGYGVVESIRQRLPGPASFAECFAPAVPPFRDSFRASLICRFISDPVNGWLTRWQD